MRRLLFLLAAVLLVAFLVAACGGSESTEAAWSKEFGALSERFAAVVESMAARSEGLRSRAAGESMFSDLDARATKVIGELEAVDTPRQCEAVLKRSLDSWRQFATFAKEMSHQPGLDVKEYASRVHANETFVLQSLSETLDDAGAAHC